MIIDPAPKVRGLATDEQDILAELLNIWRSKRRRNLIRAGRYDMKNLVDDLMSATVPDVVRRRAFVLGWPALAVDKLNRRCNIDGYFDANGTDLDDLGMDEIVRDNRLYDELSQAGLSSLIHTPSWLITTQGDTAAGEPDVLITSRDALTGAGVWDGRRRAAKYYLSLNDFDDDGLEPTSMTLYLFNLNISMEKRQAGWVVTSRRAHSYGVPVDPLRYRPRTRRPLGSSRISRAVMSIHDQALAAMIRADVNGEAYSLPRYVLLGVAESAFQNADGTAKPAAKAAWDAVWAIGDDPEAPEGLERASVQQFHGQSPEPQNAHLRMLAGQFSGETGIPLPELGVPGDSNPTSYEALMATRDDIIGEAEQTTRTWTPDVSSAMRRALVMKNKGDVPDNLEPMPNWRPAQHISRAAAADSGYKIIDKFPWLAETSVGLELVGLTRDQAIRAESERLRGQGRQNLAEILNRAQATVLKAEAGSGDQSVTQ